MAGGSRTPCPRHRIGPVPAAHHGRAKALPQWQGPSPCRPCARRPETPRTGVRVLFPAGRGPYRPPGCAIHPPSQRRKSRWCRPRPSPQSPDGRFSGEEQNLSCDRRSTHKNGAASESRTHHPVDIQDREVRRGPAETSPRLYHQAASAASFWAFSTASSMA